MTGIYKITNPENKVYIGQARNIKYRFYQYKGLFNTGQSKLYNSFKMYGFENHIFETIEECSIDELNNRERYYQDFYDCLGENGLNCVLVKSDTQPALYSKQTIERYRNRQLGVKWTDSVREKMKLKKTWNKGCKLTEEHRLKLSIAAKKRTDNRKGRILSTEHKHRLSSAILGKKHSDEAKAKISSNNAKNLSKIVFDYYSGVYYNSATELANLIGIKVRTLTKKIQNGKINYIYA